MITQQDELYPAPLREIHDPPLVLYVRGQLLARDRMAVGVVGSRRATSYGLTAARKLSFQLAHAGVTVLSGLARGIDTAAHEGAVAAKGRTIAVIGSGLGRLYPPENEALAAERGMRGQHPQRHAHDCRRGGQTIRGGTTNCSPTTAAQMA